MTPRSLFTIILKVLGIFFIKDILTSIPPLFTVFLYFFSPVNPGAIFAGVFLPTLFTLGIYTFISYTLIFKSEWVIDKFKLQQGFDQEIIPLNMHRSTILSISIIVIGGLVLVDGLPELCQQIVAYYQQQAVTSDTFQVNSKIGNVALLLPVIKVIVGVVLIKKSGKIVNFIERKRVRA